MLLEKVYLSQQTARSLRVSFQTSRELVIQEKCLGANVKFDFLKTRLCNFKEVLFLNIIELNEEPTVTKRIEL